MTKSFIGFSLSTCVSMFDVQYVECWMFQWVGVFICLLSWRTDEEHYLPNFHSLSFFLSLFHSLSQSTTLSHLLSFPFRHFKSVSHLLYISFLFSSTQVMNKFFAYFFSIYWRTNQFIDLLDGAFNITPPPLFNVCLYAYMYMHRLLNIIYVWSVNDAEQILNMRCVDIYLIILLNGHFWSNI